MDILEDCGLVKMDFLGLKTLTLIKNTVDLIKESGIEIDIDTVPEDDKKTNYELISFLTMSLALSDRSNRIQLHNRVGQCEHSLNLLKNE